jgi:hypothetical protein
VVKKELHTGLFTDIIIKPVDPDDLKKKIIEIAGKRPGL